MENDSTERIPVGPQRVTIVPPDLLVLEMADPLEVDHVTRVLDLLLEIGLSRGPHKVLMDISRVKSVPRDVREAIRSRNVAARHAAVAFVGAPFHVRIVLEMIIAAIRILKPERPRYPYAFFDRKDDALTWLHALPETSAARKDE